MDSLESVSPLDGTHSRRHTYWCWDAVHLHALLQLLDRCLPSCVSPTRVRVVDVVRSKLTFLLIALPQPSQPTSCSDL